MQQQVRPIPEGFHSLTPHLVCEGAGKAMDFYQQAFGAVDLGRMPGPDGKLMHAEVQIGNSILMLADPMPGMTAPSKSSLMLYVEDVDAWYKRAVAAGATSVMPPSNEFWGDRFCTVVDRWGNQWSIATHLEDVPPEQMESRMAEAMKRDKRPNA